MLNQILIEEFGKRIRQLRTKENSRKKNWLPSCLRRGGGVSPTGWWELTGFHRTYIGMIERGERNISLANIGVFAKALEMSVSELLLLDEVNPKHSFKNYHTKNET